MGALQLTYESNLKIVHRTGKLIRSHEAKSVQLWLSVDPLAEKFPSWSPYCYVMNNPLRLIDPTGMAPEETDPPGSKSNPHQIQTVSVSNNYHLPGDKQIAKINSGIMTSENKSNALTDAINSIGAAMFGLRPDSTDRYEGVANTGRYSPGNSGLVPLAILASPLIIAEGGIAVVS